MKVGDKVRIKSGKQIWTILKIIDLYGYTCAYLESPAGMHTHRYIDHLKLIKD